ncbi:hypothetical protein [Saccharibacter floricola]|nr:hypothetical protein [Saccharibacter floricola]
MMFIALKACPFCGSRELGCDGHYFYCTTCHATGPDEPLPDRAWAAQRWSRRCEWVLFREALAMPGFRYGVRYPAKFPTASEPHRYGHVKARKNADGRMFYYVNGLHQQTLDTRAEELWGEPVVGDVLVLVSALEEYAEQEGGE